MGPRFEAPVGEDAFIGLLDLRGCRLHQGLVRWRGDQLRLQSEPHVPPLHAHSEHAGCWQTLDALRDKNYLEHLWAKGEVGEAHWARLEQINGSLNAVTGPLRDSARALSGDRCAFPRIAAAWRH